LTNKDSCNTQIIQCVNDTIFSKRFRVPGYGTGSGTLEPVPWNRFLREITSKNHKLFIHHIRLHHCASVLTVVLNKQTNVYWTLAALVKRLDYTSIHHAYIKHTIQCSGTEITAIDLVHIR